MPTIEGRTTILLGDEQSLFREAVKALLNNEPDLEVVAEAGDGLEAVAEAKRTQPDVALLDAELPNCDGIRATSLIREAVPECRILILSSEDHQQTLLGALEAGASGYVTKALPLTELIEATRAIARGQTLVPPRMLGALLTMLIQRKRGQDHALRRLTRLTRREREVLALLADGGDNDAIAEALIISPETARTHIQNVLGKLRVHSRLEAAAFVIQNGLLPELVESER